MPLAELLERLPSPIALPLQGYLEEANPRLKLWAMCETVELLLRLLVFVGIVDLARPDGKPPQALRARLREPIERPTLGRWADMAEAVAQTLAGETDSLVPELAPWLQHMLLPLLDGSTEQNSLLALRNFLAHGGGVSRPLATRLLAAWREPFEQAMQTVAWLGELVLVVREPDGYGCLRGPTPDACPYTPGNLAAVAEALALADAVVVVRHDRAMPLWPFVLYGPPRNPYDDCPGEDSIPQLYVRQGEIHLQYTPLGGTVCHSQAGDAALARFQELFHVDRELSRAGKSRFTVRDFQDRIRGLSDRLVGRMVELATLRGLLDATSEGVIWVAGTAGIGKSSLLARVARDKLEAPPANTLVLPYWFDAGDERCQRETFLRFALERLRDWLRIAPPEDGEESPKPLQQLRDVLQKLDGRRVLFVLDGLDEITERDPHFARDVPLDLRLPGVVWLCAGRPERDLPQLFRPEIAHHPFPDGLPPMREGDIREMLLDSLTGELRKRLVGQDRERGDQVINPFIDSVAKAAHGLPLYVRYVINDIWAGRYRMLDAGERLPPSLNAYHEDHLRRCSVSSLHQILTPMVALLAVVYDEPTVDILAALLRQRTLIPAGEEGVALVREGLNALESMVRRKRDEDGQVRYALHHHSLRQHIEESPLTRQAVATAREFLGDAALQVKPDAAAAYLYCYGIYHLVKKGAGRHQDALRLLTRFDYLMARFHALRDTDAALELRLDWQAYLQSGGVLDDETRIWETFFHEKEHILRRGDDDWPAYKILLQLAIEHADDSPITQQAEAWLAQPGNCDWVWLRNPCRPEHVPVNPVVRVFEGHADTVNGAMALTDGRILSWSEDCTLRIWDRNDSTEFVELKGHAHAVTGAKELPDHRILSCSKDGTLRVWDGKTGASLEVLEVGQGELAGVEALPNGNILFWTKENVLKIIDSDGKSISLTGFNGSINDVKVTSDNTIVSWDQNKFYCWNGDTGKQVSIEEDILNNIKRSEFIEEDSDALEMLNSISEEFGDHSLQGVYIISDKYKILKMGIDFLWLLDYKDKDLPVIRKIHNGYISGFKILPNGYILIWGKQDIKLIYISSDLPLIKYQEIGFYKYPKENQEAGSNKNSSKVINISHHLGLVNDVQLLSDSRLLSWDQTTIGLWDKNTGKNIVVSPIYPRIDYYDSILKVKILANGGFLITTEDYFWHLWDGKNFYRYIVDQGEILELSDGNLLCLDDKLQIQCGTTGRVIKELKGHTKGIKDIKLLPNDRILSWSEDCTLRLWDTTTGECIIVFEGHTNAVTGAYVMSDGRILSWSEDHTLRLWNATDRECIRVMEGHDDVITSVFLLPDNCIISSSKDNTLRLWDNKSGDLINTIKVNSDHSDKFIFSGLQMQNVYELPNGNVLLISHDDLYFLNGEYKNIITISPFSFPEKIKILSNGNILVWSNYRSKLGLRIISNSTGKILVLSTNEQFIEKLGLVEDKIYFLLNDGTFGIQGIDIDEIYDENEHTLFSDFKNILYQYQYSKIFNIVGSSVSNTVKFIDHHMRWEADCAVLCKDMSDDGTYIVSASDGRILCLKLYRGANRITSDELAEDSNNLTSKRSSPPPGGV
ncbi:MAG: NACHT domain-containing protein [Candidatus Competibacter sp.]|nr:NACHT domain-containing protein [Candidatus Competibacter sp.]